MKRLNIDVMAKELDKTQIPELRKKIKKVFASLRRQGLVARGNYMCCMGCGCAAISNEFDRKVKEGLNRAHWPLGYVFYHHQDSDCLNRTGVLYLRFGQIEGSGSGESTTLTTAAVGGMIIKTLEDEGIPKVQIEWDRDPNSCIVVRCPEKPSPEVVAAREALLRAQGRVAGLIDAIKLKKVELERLQDEYTVALQVVNEKEEALIDIAGERVVLRKLDGSV